jgi:uncharacterized membrane protein YqjE
VSDGTSAESSPGGLRRALTRAGSAAVALLRTRVELASVEFQEERSRTFQRVGLLVVALLAFAFALLFASALVLVVFWDTHRITAIALVTLFYVLAGAIALWRLAVLQRTSPRPFAATLAELERDGQALTDEFHDPRT